MNTSARSATQPNAPSNTPSQTTSAARHNGPRTLWLVRHPQPLIASGICYGQSDLDVDADALRALVARLHVRVPAGLAVTSSPLLRCRVLAQAIADSRHAAPPVFDPRWAEMHFGEWEMCAWNAISRPAIDAWAADFLDYLPPGGESVRQVAARVRAAFEDWRTHGAQDALIVTHAGPMQLLMRELRGQPLSQRGEKLAYGALVECRLNAQGNIHILEHG
ncbi:histidine phosphatase family protein [Pigmentiphaga aceris]|uniref:histidine phosphatase family protein n=1 Tax=Pigmentiphaga aceris TaxID=1940612 RepID=UPI0016527AB5|nr:histidine phosphatase family protein [Pigmentiphaga aceris]